MSTQEGGEPDIQFIYGLHLPYMDEGPFVIGEGSFEDLDRILGEVKEINAAETGDPDTLTRAGVQHFYREFGRNSGHETEAEIALDFTDILAGASRQAYVERLRRGEPNTDPQPPEPPAAE